MGGDDGHMHAFSSWTYHCDGTAWFPYGYGRPSSWTVHFLAGLTFLAWGFHWMVSASFIYFKSNPHRPYTARASFRFPSFLRHLPIESVLKIMVPAFAVLTQLWWAHGQWWSFTCPSWETRAGRMDPTHIDSWINSWGMFMFMISGVVDLLGQTVKLPPGCEHSFIGLAFFYQSLILGQYFRIDALDQMAYFLQFLMSAGTTTAIFAELLSPSWYFLTLAKVFFTLMQGAWYVATAHVMYQGINTWSSHEDVVRPDGIEHQHDAAPAMFLPVIFTWVSCCVSICMALTYAAMGHWQSHVLSNHLKSECTVEKTLLLSESANASTKAAPSKEGHDC